MHVNDLVVNDSPMHISFFLCLTYFWKIDNSVFWWNSNNLVWLTPPTQVFFHEPTSQNLINNRLINPSPLFILIYFYYNSLQLDACHSTEEKICQYLSFISIFKSTWNKNSPSLFSYFTILLYFCFITTLNVVLVVVKTTQLRIKYNFVMNWIMKHSFVV